MTSEQLTNWIKKRAIAAGFSSVGVAPALGGLGTTHLDAWLESGYAGTMTYLADRRDAYNHPNSILDGVQSLVMLTLNYRTTEPCSLSPGFGRVSRYAWGGADYHDLIHARLKQLAGEMRTQIPEARVRGVVDTAPLLEREYAQLSGLGWIGKHTLLLNRNQGSWFFLAALLTDCQLEHDAEPATDHCGTCTACLDVCPTDAFPQPYVLDASRCISYLTIEHRGPISQDLRPKMGEWLFGCDLCQDVCPWNRKSPETAERSFAPLADRDPVDLAGLFSLDDDAFRTQFRNTPLWRPKRRGMLRNAAIVLGNRLVASALPALVLGLNDNEPLVRGASAWALAHYGQSAHSALTDRSAIEIDPYVRQEISAALAMLEDASTSQAG